MRYIYFKFSVTLINSSGLRSYSDIYIYNIYTASKVPPQSDRPGVPDPTGRTGIPWTYCGTRRVMGQRNFFSDI